MLLDFTFSLLFSDCGFYFFLKHKRSTQRSQDFNFFLGLHPPFPVFIFISLRKSCPWACWGKALTTGARLRVQLILKMLNYYNYPLPKIFTFFFVQWQRLWQQWMKQLVPQTLPMTQHLVNINHLIHQPFKSFFIHVSIVRIHPVKSLVLKLCLTTRYNFHSTHKFQP